MAKKKVSNVEIKQIYDRMDAEARKKYYDSFLQTAKKSFKSFNKLLMWAGFLIIVALVGLIPTNVMHDPFYGYGSARNSQFLAILCIFLSVVCICAAFGLKMKNKIKITVFFALNLIGIFVVGLTRINSGMITAVKEAGWVILFIINTVAVIMTLKSCKKAESVREWWINQAFAAVFVLNTALTYGYARYILANHINDEAALPLMSIILAVIGLVLYVRSTYPHAITAFRAANTCKALKGAREDGTKKIYRCTLYPVINAYSLFFVLTFMAAMFTAIMSAVVSSNNPRHTSTVRVTYSDGRQSYYVEDEKIYDEQNRQIGRMIGGRVYDNNMNQTGYVSGDKIIPM